jgi:hypothetical protein
MYLPTFQVCRESEFLNPHIFYISILMADTSLAVVPLSRVFHPATRHKSVEYEVLEAVITYEDYGLLSCNV